MRLDDTGRRETAPIESGPDDDAINPVVDVGVSEVVLAASMGVVVDGAVFVSPSDPFDPSNPWDPFNRWDPLDLLYPLDPREYFNSLDSWDP